MSDNPVPAPSTEAVEAGARALYPEHEDFVVPWAGASGQVRDDYRRQARAVLAAASPEGEEGQLQDALRDLLAAVDVQGRSADCVHCDGEPQEDCEECFGTGHVVLCARCHGTIQLGPEGDLNCPCGNGIDYDATVRQVRFAQEHGEDFVTAATDRARRALQPIETAVGVTPEGE